MIYINCSVCKSSYFLYNSKTWTLHLKSSSSYVHIILLLGGISEHFIWQVDLVEHFIWKVDLILWLFQMGSHWRHRWGNSWSAVTGSFRGENLTAYLGTSSENVNSYLMSMCTSSCSLHLTTMGEYIWQLIWAPHLKIWTHFRFGSCFTEVFSTKDQ